MLPRRATVLLKTLESEPDACGRSVCRHLHDALVREGGVPFEP